VSERIETVNTDLHQQVVEIFADIFQLDLDPATTDIKRDTVEQWDSVNHLRLVLELEQVFGVTLSDDDVLGIASLRDVEAVLTRHGVDGASTIN
jgi:acyl carrier protein